MGWIADLLQEIPSAARYKSELEAMEKQNATLQRRVSELEAEVANLRPQAPQTSAELAADAEAILAVIAQYSDAEPKAIAAKARIEVAVAEMHIEDLLEAKYIEGSYAIGDEPRYHLTQKGRRFLHAQGRL